MSQRSLPQCQGWQRSCSQSTACWVKLSKNPTAHEVKAYQASLSFQQLTLLCLSGTRAPRETPAMPARGQGPCDQTEIQPLAGGHPPTRSFLSQAWRMGSLPWIAGVRRQAWTLQRSTSKSNSGSPEDTDPEGRHKKGPEPRAADNGGRDRPGPEAKALVWQW